MLWKEQVGWSSAGEMVIWGCTKFDMPVRHANGDIPSAVGHLNLKFTRVDWTRDMFVFKAFDELT